jgi:hypothetical protein
VLPRSSALEDSVTARRWRAPCTATALMSGMFADQMALTASSTSAFRCGSPLRPNFPARGPPHDPGWLSGPVGVAVEAGGGLTVGEVCAAVNRTEGPLNSWLAGQGRRSNRPQAVDNAHRHEAAVKLLTWLSFWFSAGKLCA